MELDAKGWMNSYINIVGGGLGFGLHFRVLPIGFAIYLPQGMLFQQYSYKGGRVRPSLLQ